MSRIIEKIQKLLRLAQNAGSEAEAALAAQRAADLMAAHEIHEAEISLADPTELRAPEPIEKCFEVTTTKKRVAWHMRVTNAVARSYGAMAYWSGGRVVLFGRLSAVQAANYTAHYLMREVDKITDKEAATTAGYSKTYRNSFRLGCANRVADRLDELTEAKKKAPTIDVTEVEAAETAAAAATEVPNIFDDEVEEEGAPEMPEPKPEEAPKANPMALAIIEKDREEVKKEYETYSKKWRRGPRIGQVSSGSGYSAGRAAGNRVNLGGKSKGGLPKGQDVLR